MRSSSADIVPPVRPLSPPCRRRCAVSRRARSRPRPRRPRAAFAHISSSADAASETSTSSGTERTAELSSPNGSTSKPISSKSAAFFSMISASSAVGRMMTGASRRLAHYLPVLRLEAVKYHALVRCVLVDEHKLVADLRKDIGIQRLADHSAGRSADFFNIFNWFFNIFSLGSGRKRGFLSIFGKTGLFAPAREPGTPPVRGKRVFPRVSAQTPVRKKRVLQPPPQKRPWRGIPRRSCCGKTPASERKRRAACPLRALSRSAFPRPRDRRARSGKQGRKPSFRRRI